MPVTRKKEDHKQWAGTSTKESSGISFLYKKKEKSIFFIDILAEKDGDKDPWLIKVANRVYVLKSL